MQGNLKIVNGEYICLKSDHNQPVLAVNICEGVVAQDRFLCVECFKQLRQIVKLISFEEAQQLIEENQNVSNEKQEDTINKNLLLVNNLKTQLSEIQSRFFMQISQLINITTEWTSELQKQKQQYMGEIEMIQKLELLLYRDSVSKEEEIQKINQSYYVKIMKEFNSFCGEDYQKIFQEILQKFNIPKPVVQIEQIPLKPPEQKKIIPKQRIPTSKKIEQDMQSLALAFNGNDSVICAGSQKELKIWRFEGGKLYEQQRVLIQQENIECLVFSQKQNWFLMGSSDSSITCWKQGNNSNWGCSYAGIQHTSSVKCLVLNNKEDELISCGLDMRIIHWKIDNKDLYFKYSFEQRHKAGVISISLNKAETALVSSGLDQTIILWKYQNIQRKWTYQHHVENDDIAKTIRFIGNFEILMQKNSKGVCHILKYQDGKLIMEGVVVDFDNLQNDQPLFPIIINQNKEKLLMIYNHWIYILQKNIDCKLRVISKPIDCGTQNFCAALTRDGEYALVQTNQSHELKIHKMNYE